LGKLENKNITWQKNHALIMEAYDKLYDETGSVPTFQRIAKECKLSENTVYKHAESLTVENVNVKYKIAAARVTKRLLKNIEENGKAAEVKLYNQLVMGYRESNTNEIVIQDKEKLFEDLKKAFEG